MNLSEPQLISPLLDGFVMGNPINEHDGVRSCPAMLLESDQKYIVKIISLPATQSKLDALLLAGAFSDQASALAYFKELADGVIEEAELLQRLSRFEGFVSFDNWQLVPMEDGETGYDIYLLSAYRPTLEGILRANEMTHLGAINLGLDLCAACAVARRNGYLYGNLRPSNVYVCNEREYRIGDLGFLRLDSLPYASLPDKYRSAYTPPEIADAYSALNHTMDTYAIGLILYQAYNDGQLPSEGMPISAPRHATHELAEIILKACADNPEDRWADPGQMGQALAHYMQSNSVNNTPIVPPSAVEEEIVTVVEEVEGEPSTEDILAEVDQALETAPPLVAGTADAQSPAESTEECACEEVPAPTDSEDDVDQEQTEAENEQTEDTDEILAQAEDLIAHQLPDPVVPPEAIEVTLPVPEQTEPEEPVSEQNDVETDESPVSEESAEEEAPVDEPAEEPVVKAPAKKHHKGLTTFIVTLLVLALLFAAGALFYQQYYLQTVYDITLVGAEDRLTVNLTSDIPDAKLSVKCTDTHGNSITSPVQNGSASFVGLKPATSYELEVCITGLHKLVGKTTASYNTQKQITVSGFSAATGTEDGSVFLSFTAQYPNDVTDVKWIAYYSADGEPEKSIIFEEHRVTIPGLTLGKEYTFRIEPISELYLAGTNTITYIPSKIVYAENLEILSFADNRLTLQWSAPADAEVAKWYIRCTSGAEYDQTFSTTEITYSIENLPGGLDYTIEVTAEGMHAGVRTYLSANSITVSNLTADASNPNALKIQWEHTGNTPENGWQLFYTLDGDTKQQIIQCAKSTATITPLIPGAHYTILIQAANGTTVFGGKLEYDAPEAKSFNNYSIKAKNITLSMCKTPSKANWDKDDVSSKNYTTTFKTGVSASFVMKISKSSPQEDIPVVTLYLIRDAEGKLVSYHYESRTWDDMWNNRYGTLTIPQMPEQSGSYTVEILFDGATVGTQSFTVTD